MSVGYHGIGASILLTCIRTVGGEGQTNKGDRDNGGDGDGERHADGSGFNVFSSIARSLDACLLSTTPCARGSEVARYSLVRDHGVLRSPGVS